MSVQILEGGNGGAVFYCSTSDWAFGPLMPDAEIAEAFLRTFIEGCPLGHKGKVDIDNQGNGITHFSCYEQGCKAVWDLQGNVIDEEEDTDDLTEAERLGESRAMR